MSRKRRRLGASLKAKVALAAVLPVQYAAARSPQVAFPNGVTLTLPADDHELIQRSIAADSDSPSKAPQPRWG